MRNVFVEVFVHGLYKSKSSPSSKPLLSNSDEENDGNDLLCCIMGARFAASRSKRKKCCVQVVQFFLLGIVIGLLFGVIGNSVALRCRQSWHGNFSQDTNDSFPLQSLLRRDDMQLPYNDDRVGSKPSGLLFVGVMTTKNFVRTRAQTASRTWVQTIQGKVVFFSSEGSETEASEDLDIVGLQGVDDAYPPQRKSFLMLKYMHDNFIDQYEWFVRADDDIYIRGEKLAAFLYSINSSRPQFLGQAGLGNKEEFGLLHLQQNENFCMGGPGIAMSRATLKLIAPHISTCLQHLYSTHEDVEVGRCVAKYANISCTWAFEMQHLFYHNHNDPDDSFTGALNVKDIHRAITLHPVKRPAYNYRLHNFFRTRKSADLAHRLLLLSRDVRTMGELMKVGGQTGTLGRGQGQRSTGASSNDSTSLLPSVVKYVPAKVADVLPWEFLSSKAAFSHATTNPTRAVESGVRHAVDEVILQVMNTINKNARRRGRSIDFKEVLYGYRRVDPLHGADYILDLLLVYRKHKGRRMTIPVRRHAYIQQPFTALEFRELDPTLVGQEVVSATVGVGGLGTGVSSPASLLGYFQEKLASSLAMLNSAAAVAGGGQQPNGAVTASTTVSRLHFLVPLAGRHERLVDFMKNFESVCLIPEKVVSLYVLLFDSDDAQKSIALLNKYQQAYPQHIVRVEQVAGPFSRGGGLARGCSLLDASALVVFMDIDIHMTREAIYRLRMNAIQSKQVYYPIVFSGYDSQVYCSSLAAGSSCNLTRQAPFADHTGYWRQSGYGIVSMYNSDFAAIGGFDANIQGWGKEDVELFERLLAAANVTLFRAVDPGLTHVFHAVNCDANLESVQYKMCLGTKAASYASLATLSRIVYAESWYKATDVASKVVRPPKLRGKA